MPDLISLIKDRCVRKKVLTLDVCHAGIELGRAIIDQEFIDNVYNNAEGFVLLAASTALQKAYESIRYKHGLITYSLNQGLKGDADFDGDGRITVEDLRNYALNSIRSWNKGNGRRQEPTYKSDGIGEITMVFPQ